MSPVIKVENLSKYYRLGLIGGKTLHDDLNRWWARVRKQPDPLLKIGQEDRRNGNDESIWALREVSFEVQQGEIVGIIGRNGAGKSTLLKILSRITAPTSGQVKVKGRIASLLEVGTGFHPELTGRENIYLNGAILGMKKAEIDRKFDEIVDFAEVEKFIDTPVKRYSSGMYVRLAFAVAAHLEPEILVVDEVLAVGDAAFQKKCLGKMREVARAGRTVLFVSHNLSAVHQLTEKCVYLKNGQVVDYDITQETVNQYLQETLDYNKNGIRNLDYYRQDPKSAESSPATLARVIVHGEPQGFPTIEMNSTVALSLEIEAKKEIGKAMINMIIKNARGEHAAVFCSYDQDFSLSLQPGRYSAEMQIDDFPFAPGEYFCNVGIASSTQSVVYDNLIDFPLFRVVNKGQIVHWLGRPWGTVHWRGVKWSVSNNVA